MVVVRDFGRDSTGVASSMGRASLMLATPGSNIGEPESPDAAVADCSWTAAPAAAASPPPALAPDCPGSHPSVSSASIRVSKVMGENAEVAGSDSAATVPKVRDDVDT